MKQKDLFDTDLLIDQCPTKKPTNEKEAKALMDLGDKTRSMALATDKRPIGELVSFLATKIKMSGLYQPAIIKALLNGPLTKEELSLSIKPDFNGQFLTHKQYDNSKAIRKARSMADEKFLFSKLGIHPKKTMLNHELIVVEKLGRKEIWALNFVGTLPDEKDYIIGQCNTLLNGFIQDQAKKEGL